MNFIAAQLIKHLEEEEAFWVFTCLVETLLPLDYYQHMAGVLIDQEVFYEFFKTKLPKLHKHFNRLEFDPKLVIFQWFVCLFSSFLHQSVSLKVLDYFFLKGINVIFQTAMGVFILLQKKLLSIMDFGKQITFRRTV